MEGAERHREMSGVERGGRTPEIPLCRAAPTEGGWGEGAATRAWLQGMGTPCFAGGVLSQDTPIH